LTKRAIEPCVTWRGYPYQSSFGDLFGKNSQKGRKNRAAKQNPQYLIYLFGKKTQKGRKNRAARQNTQYLIYLFGKKRKKVEKTGLLGKIHNI